MKCSTRRFLAGSVMIMGFMSSPCWAYLDVLDTGEVLPKGSYKLTGDTQILTSQGGLNLGAIADLGIQDQFGARAIVGFGRTDYSFGGMFKWMPIPDVDGQPAIGMNAGLVYGKWNDSTDLTFRVEPLISKKFNMESNTILTPYASLPIGMRVRNSSTQDTASVLTWQLALGTQLQIEKWKNLQFMAEVGLDLGNALSYVTVAAVWYFDEQNGFQLK
jgi:hypothetical protein